MRGRWWALVLVLALVTPAVAQAAPLPPPDQPPGDAVAHFPLRDADGNKISDGLQAMLETAEPSDRLDIIATFADRDSADAAERTLPPPAIASRFDLIPGFSAGLNRGQINGLANHPGVVRIEETFQVTALNNSANADFGTELARTDWGVDGTGVGICIADTGIDPGHEQLDDPGKIAGWADFINGNGTPYDDHGHGSHVAGTAAGSGTGGSNADTYKGVAPNATLYIAKVLDANGFSSGTSVQDGVAWCAAQPGVAVISMSLGSPTGSDGLDSLSLSVDAAVDLGKIVVVAAGNSGETPESVGSPGAAEKAITVGAVAEHSVPPGSAQHSPGVYLAPFSSRGPTLGSPRIKPDIVSPGVTITSADAGTTAGYATFSGTSMATPFTVGTIALMLDADPSLTYSQVTNLIRTTSQDRGPTGKDNHFGWGLIDGYSLVSEASGAGSYSPTSFPTYAAISGSVPTAGVTAHTFDIGAADLSIPIAATILIDGSLECSFPVGPYCFAYEWAPDLEARIKDPNNTVLAISECPATGDCGSDYRVGQQETLHVMPTDPGTYTIEIYTAGSTGPGGTYNIYLSRGPVGPPDSTPPSPPPSLTATPSGFAVDLVWSAAIDPESGISSYRIWRDDGAAGPMTLLAELSGTRTTYRDTAVQGNRTYNYEITSVNTVSLESAASSPASSLTGPADTALLGWWALDDGSGTTATDSAPPSRDGTLVNGPTWVSDGKIAGALDFDGNDDRIDLDSSILDGATDLTTAFWMRTPTGANPDIRAIVSAANSENDQDYLLALVWNPDLQLRAYTGETFETFVAWSTPFLEGGSWHHVAVTRDDTSDEMKLYIDGIPQGAQSTTLNALAVDSGGLIVGQEQDSVGDGMDPGQALVGGIDELRFYDRVLAPTEIEDLAGLPDTTAPAAPTGLAATPGDGEISLDWDDNTEPDLSSYAVHRSETPGGPYTEIGVTSTSDYSDETTADGTTYYYVVTARDHFGNSSTHSIQTSATPLSASTTMGSSVGFSGDDVVDVGDVGNLSGDLTYELWVKPGDLDVRRNPLAKAYSGEGTITQGTDGRLTFYQGDGGGNTSGWELLRSSPLTPGVWSHVVVVRSGTSLTWYINGAPDTSKTMTKTPAASTLPLLIGDGYTNGYVGGIDEVAIYDRALTPTEITDHYNTIAVDHDHTTYGTMVTGDNPISYWRLDEQTGPNALDETNMNPGLYEGTPTLSQPGADRPSPIVGSSVGFSGDDVVDVGDVGNLSGDLTYELWVKPGDLDVRRNPLAKAYSGEGTITQGTDGRLTFYQGDGGGNTSGWELLRSSPLTPGVWSHVVVVRSGTSLTWYINGAPDTSKTMTKTPAASTLPLLIGDGYTNGYVGGIDEVAIYDRALTPTEITDHYNTIAVDHDHTTYGTMVTGDNPISYWRLDEQTGPNALDETNMNPGLYEGTPTLSQPGADRPSPIVGSSVGFSGDDVVDVGDVGNLSGDLTYELWVKPGDLDVRRNPLAKAYSGEGTITQGTDGRLTFYQGDGGGNTSGWELLRSSPLTPGVWSHVVVVRSGTSLTWYINGAPDTSKTMTKTPAASTLPLLIGDGYTNGYVGGIDEVAIYDRALTPTEITDHYNTIAVDHDHTTYGTMVTGDNPISYWRLDEQTGPNALDETNMNPGLYEGTPTLSQPGAS